MIKNKIICGAMPEAAKVFPDGYFNCSISSPPYWGLRDYGLKPSIWDGDKNCKHKWQTHSRYWDNRAASLMAAGEGTDFAGKKDVRGHQKSDFCSKCNAWRGCLGLEPTFELYIEHLCTIYDEVKRILRDDGTCWVNLGDTYHNATKWTYTDGAQTISKGNPRDLATGRGESQGLPEKCLCLIPQRFAIEMVNRGWILRNVIIWHKPNPMPSSAKDRFTVDFEYVYFFVKSRKYWFEPQYEPAEYGYSPTTKGIFAGSVGGKHTSHTVVRGDGTSGRNKRTVWTIPTQSFPEAHFATFPEKLVEPMIKAGCPKFVCTKCGKAREKIYDVHDPEGRLGKGYHDHENDLSRGQRDVFPAEGCPTKTFKGYTDCGCNADWRPGIVLDCFCRNLYHWQGRRKDG